MKKTTKKQSSTKKWTNQELNSLRILVRTYYDYQRERIRLEGMLGIKKNEEIKKGIPERDEAVLAKLYDRKREIESFMEGIEKDIHQELKNKPLWKLYLKGIKGCGEMMAAVIMTQFNINIAETVSKMWQFSGMNPGLIFGKKKDDDNEEIIVTADLIRGDRKTKGFLSPFNAFLKAKLLGVLGSSFLKSKAPYTKIYYDEKNRLENSEVMVKEIVKGGNAKMVAWKDATPNHRHMAANRKMVKEFLKDLYVNWRTMEGLSVRKPYAEEYLGKSHPAGETHPLRASQKP